MAGTRHDGGLAVPANGGATRHAVWQALATGRASVRTVARDLNLHHSTIVQHRDSLLAAGALVAGRKVGRQQFYKAGPKAGLEKVRDAHKPASKFDRPPPQTPTARAHARVEGLAGPWVATSGARTFTILRAPGIHPTDMPGFIGTRLSGRGADAKKRRDHKFAWTQGGRTAEFVLMESPTSGVWSLQLRRVRPAPFLADIAPDGDHEAGWDRFAFDVVHAWAALAQVQVSPDRSLVRRSRRVESALLEVMPEGVKFSDPDFAADDTPEPKTLEAMTQEYREAIGILPEFQTGVVAALDDQDKRFTDFLDENERRAARITRYVERVASEIRTLVEAAEKMVTIQAGQDRTLAALLTGQLSATGAAVASPPPPPSDTKEGYT